MERTPFLVAGIFWLMIDLTVRFFLSTCDMCASPGNYIIEGATSPRAAKKSSKKKSKDQPSSDLFLKSLNALSRYWIKLRPPIK